MTINNMYFIANWKMYGNLSSIKSINKVIRLSKLQKYSKAKIVYCPPNTILDAFIKKTKKTKISVGAQNCHFINGYGPCTGFVSPKMIRDIGSKYVIIGHSENRNEGESNFKINLKINAALRSNLNVIFCIGETLKEKKKKKTLQVLRGQIKQGLKKIKLNKNFIIAYEPVWSIGTGIVPSFKELNNNINKIKKIIKPIKNSKKIKIIYGGSVKSSNVKFLSKIPGINGFLIGGSSINSKKFIDIIKKTIN